ncbi:hypothetical protein ACW95P_02780 [Candidatus Mycoplasma pogonae]
MICYFSFFYQLEILKPFSSRIEPVIAKNKSTKYHPVQPKNILKINKPILPAYKRSKPMNPKNNESKTNVVLLLFETISTYSTISISLLTLLFCSINILTF